MNYTLKPEIIENIKSNDQLILNISLVNSVSFTTVKHNWLYGKNTEQLTLYRNLKLIADALNITIEQLVVAQPNITHPSTSKNFSSEL